MNQTGFLLDARTNLRFGHQFIIQIDGRSYAYKYAYLICISQPRQKRVGVWACRRVGVSARLVVAFGKRCDGALKNI
jgi:hypothetical protein